MKKCGKMVGNLLLYILGYFSAQIIVSLVLFIMVLLKVIYRHRSPLEAVEVYNNILNTNSNLLLLCTSFVALIIFILIFADKEQNLFKYCRFTRIKPINIFMLIVLGFGMMITIGSIISLIPVDKIFPEYNKIINDIAGDTSSPIVILSVGFLVPIFEEIMFRGIIFNKLRENINVFVAVVLQAALFGLFHLNLLQGIYAFFLGLILAFVYVWTRTIWSSIIVHMSFNTVSLLNSMINIQVNLLMLITVGIVLFIFAIFFIYRNERKI